MGTARALPIDILYHKLIVKMATYTRDTVVTVQPFTRQTEGDEVIIGKADTGVFLALPAPALDLLDHLAEGKNVGETADLFQQKYGEIPDLEDFLGLLETKGIVSPGLEPQIGEPVARPAQPQRRVRYHFANFPQSLAKRLFSAPVLGGCLMLIGLAVSLMVLNPLLAPGRRDLHFPDHRTLTYAMMLVLSYSTLYIHELAHLVAARAVGISSRIGISHRLWFLVAETDLTGLWSVPKQQRILPMLAGVLIDCTSASMLVFVLFMHEHGWLALPIVAVRLLRAMAFVYLMRVVWQFLLHIRTDFYFIIASLLNCRNLMKDTQIFLRNQVARFIPRIRRIDQSGIPEHERKVIRVYSFLWILGRTLSICVLLFITLPVAGRYFRSLGHAFRVGYSRNPADFVDAVLFSTAFLTPLVAGFTLWIKSLVTSKGT